MSDVKQQLFKILSDEEKDEKLEFIKNNPIIVGDPERGPEEKEYLLLLYLTDDNGDEELTFEFCIGRTTAYNYIKNIIECIDIHKSMILVEGIGLEKRVSIYEFMKYVSDYVDDSFDIEDYNKGDI